MTRGWLCGWEWEPGAERPAGEWVGALVVLNVLLLLAAVLVVAV